MEEQVEPSPLYRQVADHYRSAIRLGTLAADQRLPSLRDMMRTHQVSLSTAVQACRCLESEGLVEARTRSGYFVVAASGANTSPLSARSIEASDATDVDLFSASVDELLAMARRKPIDVDLAIATCAPCLYPTAELRKLTTAVIRDDENILVSSASSSGNARLRQALARRALARGIRVAPEEVIVTHGASEGLALALRAVTRPGDAVLLESPTYYGALQLLHSLDVAAIELPTNTQHGLLPEAVEFALREQSRVAAIVNMPTLHNPLGSTMPNEARERLVALCATHGIALIEDDVYADLHPGASRLRAQKSWDRSGHVIYCASLNKSLSPGLRLGWMLGGRWHDSIETLKMAQSRPKEELQQRVAARFLESSAFDRHIRRLHRVLERQRQEMVALVGETFPAGSAVHNVDAGMLLWVKLPGGVSSRRLFSAALDQRIRIVPGAIFSSSPYFDAYIRLSCGWPLSRERVDAVAKLGQLCDDLKSGSSAHRSGGPAPA